MTATNITLTNLPDELLDKIFSYLTFIERINARTINKAMTAFQARNYGHIFNRIRAAFKTPFITGLLSDPEICSQKTAVQYVIPDGLLDTNKLVSYNRTKWRELSAKYMSKFAYLFNYVCNRHTIALSDEVTTIDANHIKLIELLAEIVYTDRKFVLREVNRFQACLQWWPRHTILIYKRKVFASLLCILLMNNYNNKYYDLSKKYGVDLTSDELVKLCMLYPHINELRSYISKYDHKGYITFTDVYFCSNVKFKIYITKGFDAIDSIKYYRPSALRNFSDLKSCSDIFYDTIIDTQYTWYGAELRKPSRKDVYSRFILQSRRDDEEVYQQALVDSKLYPKNNYTTYGCYPSFDDI